MAKKKGLFAKLVDKLDKGMKEKAKKSTCSCCGTKKGKGKC